MLLNILKSLLFLKNNSKKRKSPSAEVLKGWKLTSSPYWTLSELLREILQLKMLD